MLGAILHRNGLKVRMPALRAVFAGHDSTVEPSCDCWHPPNSLGRRCSPELIAMQDAYDVLGPLEED